MTSSATIGVMIRQMVSLTRNAEKKPHTSTTAMSSTSGCRARVMMKPFTSRKKPDSLRLATRIIMPSSSVIVSKSIGDSQIRAALIQDAGWNGGQHPMARPYSLDLRERVVAAVEKGGMSRRRAAAQFGVGISTVINWVRRLRETGSVAPGKMGGHKPKAIAGEHRAWLLQRAKDRDFTLARCNNQARCS